ncbi:PhoPQ-activated pathogenicity-like protein PqaA type [Euzebyella marina]|uniref:PhoPQ-activated pathogenicity-like protein PqaA type n=1 Tax=Euzebyella marina TaxID=1761453 RepID=A0A3G2L8N2_9FLAO|nr:PhoPQ-activated protein PqaA family protein [Euzebyella marina]AYN68610.1 PhoPQ-activated pathogenicity-like protein PqaA type [Euzebyella marina]
MKKILNTPFWLVCLVCVGLINSCKESKKDAVAEAETVAEVTPENALKSYLENGDETFSWVLKDSFDLQGVKAYDLLLTSQKWREHTWKHQLTIFVPENIEFDGSLLFITGGHLKDGEPKWKNMDKEGSETEPMALMAMKNKAITAIVRQVPMQPLYEGDLVEDQLISFTLHNFKNDKDYTWPLLFPMVKSAVRAMDAVQEFSQEKLKKKVSRFTVSGASKRGWTTWLTGASDKRVEAIAPMVIDVLNMPVSLDYHLESWNEYSVQINDYIKLEIPQTVNTGDGQALTQMIDPYSYRADLTMPKLIFIGTNDEYWPVDAIKHYINDIPGENYIHYTPNAGHNLGGGEEALKSLSGFWAQTLAKEKYDNLNYKIDTEEQSATLSVSSSTDNLTNAFLWTADSTDRDFRDEEWSSTPIKLNDDGEVSEEIDYPKTGFKAFYIDLEYKDINGGTYTKSTRMYLADDDEVL